jgi:hypothetical protein
MRTRTMFLYLVDVTYVINCDMVPLVCVCVCVCVCVLHICDNSVTTKNL